jgi:hypothetical protein
MSCEFTINMRYVIVKLLEEVIMEQDILGRKV